MEILVFPNEVIGKKFIWNTRYPEEFIQIQVDCVVTESIGLQQQYYENVTCYYLSKSFSVGHGNSSDDSHSSVSTYRTLDMLSSGNRWEGDIKGESSYGYGVLYNDKGEKVYEGFMFNGIIQGYGCSFYPGLCQTEYIGTFYNGKRQGYGRMYDRKGNIVYEGIWMNDSTKITQQIIVPEEMNNLEGFHSYIETVVINQMCCNDRSFNTLSITNYSRLKSLHIEHNCFQYVRRVEICHNAYLESIVIKSNCFYQSLSNMDSMEIQERIDRNKSCIIQHCNQLSQITVGKLSFGYYEKLDLKGFIICMIIL